MPKGFLTLTRAIPGREGPLSVGMESWPQWGSTDWDVQRVNISKEGKGNRRGGDWGNRGSGERGRKKKEEQGPFRKKELPP